MKLKCAMDEKAVRKLIIKMATLAKDWQDPYDDMDHEVKSKNLALKDKWQVYAEILEDILEG